MKIERIAIDVASEDVGSYAMRFVGDRLNCDFLTVNESLAEGEPLKDLDGKTIKAQDFIHFMYFGMAVEAGHDLDLDRIDEYSFVEAKAPKAGNAAKHQAAKKAAKKARSKKAGPAGGAS